MAADAAFDPAIEALCRKVFAAPPLDCQPIEAGLGARRFFRVTLAGAPQRAIARCEQPEDASLRPPGVAAEPPLEPVRALLAAAGLRVPHRYGASTDGQIELLEDLGDETLEACANAAPAAERRTLYGLACRLVPRLQQVDGDPTAIPNLTRRLDDRLFDYKADQICRWLIPETTASQRQVVFAAFDHIKAAAADAPQRLAHRDFKAQNLHLVPGADGRRELAMIDLQGAFLAPPEYDLVCLLRDLHVELEAELVEACLAEIRPRLPDAPPAEEFERRFRLLTLSRVGKDTARFLYAAHVRGDPRYLAFVPTGLRYLRDAAARSAGLDPALERFSDLVAQLPEPACAQ